MLKKLFATTAISAVMITAALAQAPTPPASSPPSAAPPAPMAPSKAAPPASSSAASPASSAQVITQQNADQLLASKFKGTDVLGPDDKKVGDISDILFSKDGKIEAYVVSVGGFLGIGSKEVAMAPSAFQVVPASTGSSSSTTGSATSSSAPSDAIKLKISMSQDQLKQAASFKTYQSASNSSTAPATRPATPMSPNR